MSLANAAIFFEPDGYVMSGPKLMGRQAAGNAFLRAAVAASKGRPLWAYTPQRSSAEVFDRMVRELDSQVDARWVPADRLDTLSEIGTLYLPGPGLTSASRLRLRAGAGAYSLTGVTHTTASHAAMDAITGLLSAPVMPWDALICTSDAVAGTVKVLLEAEADYLRWRFGSQVNFTLPQLPIIPLGVHCDDFVFSDEERIEARRQLGIADDEVVALFVGRLSFHAKAHPHAMYEGLQAAAKRTGKKIVLLQCGWFANQAIEQSFTDGAARFCPDVRALFTDGKDADVRRRSWACADFFISLSDNIQETFGLTPIEALAAGLPVIVTDWDGYKDTVRDDIDGYRVPTWMAPPNLGDGLARAHEAGVENYDYYCGLACQTVSVDMQALAERLTAVVDNPALRRQMGEAGRKRAREVFDWSVVFRQYQDLWSRLGELRRAARNDSRQQELLTAAPRAAASRLDPFRSFAHYPTHLIGLTSTVELTTDASAQRYGQLAQHGLHSYAQKIMPELAFVEAIFAALTAGALDVATLAQRCGREPAPLVLALSVLSKMGLVRLSEAGTAA